MDYYCLNSIEKYREAKKQAREQPEKFWGEIAKNNFKWKKDFEEVLEYDFYKPSVRWFVNGKLNITENCIDRHLKTRADKTAIIWEPNDPNEDFQKISYRELSKKVNRFANVLRSKGIKKGDRICVYLPMVPELAYAVLACARIGAIHSVVFAGFSSKALAVRINDADCSMVITSDGSFRGDKIINLKGIVDEALDNCPTVNTVLVVKRTKTNVFMKENRDFWLNPLLSESSEECKAEVMDSEDPLFILYTSGSTGKPKGMLHTCAGYMVYTAYTFKNIFQYKEPDIYWCTADIGWITGHSYIVYGPLLNGATSLMFEGIPSYPDFSRFWSLVEKHRINQFYTAPTAIRALAKQSLKFVESYDLSSLKVLGTVGEPINEEAWNWYFTNIGKEKCQIVDTWWQTETGGILISNIPNVTKGKPTFATLPFTGIQAQLIDENGQIIKGSNTEGNLCIEFPWPGIARTIYEDHNRYKNIYFSKFPGYYFTGDGALRDEEGNYRITGRVDDIIIVSGHNLGTAPIENAINQHDYVAESAVVSYPHSIKGNALYGFICLKGNDGDGSLKEAINALISKQIGPIAKLDQIQFVEALPKTRSGKIMRRILRKIAINETSNLGDISTLLNPNCVDDIIRQRLR